MNIVEQRILRTQMIRDSNVARAHSMLSFPHQDKAHNREVAVHKPGALATNLPRLAKQSYIVLMGRIIYPEGRK